MWPEKKNWDNFKIAVGGLVFWEDRVLLCKSPKWSDKWLIPGGGMLPGETIEETLKREIKEETGLEVELESIGEVKSVNRPKEFKEGKMDFLMIDCVCRSKSDQVKLSEEHSEYKWVLPEEALLMSDLLSYSKKPIENYLRGKKEQDYLAGWQRCKADFDNYQKKVSELLSTSEEKIKERLILEVLPVLDNFNLAVAHIPKESEKEGWVAGVIYIKKQLEDFLKKEGVEEVTVLGEKFDPACAECLEESVDEKEENKGKIIEVTRKGYRMGERIIRAAQVKVVG